MSTLCFKGPRERSANENTCPLFRSEKRTIGGEKVSGTRMVGIQLMCVEGRKEGRKGGREKGREGGLNLEFI